MRLCFKRSSLAAYSFKLFDFILYRSRDVTQNLNKRRRARRPRASARLLKLAVLAVSEFLLDAHLSRLNALIELRIERHVSPL